MDRAEAKGRDRVLRAFFQGKDWDRNDEFMLKRNLVLRSHELLPAFPFLVDDEWDVVAGQTNNGRGDVVFADGEGAFAVVEVKYIDLERSGRTARAKRTDSRGKVLEQARTYAVAAAHRYQATGGVLALAYTNESPDVLVEVGRVDLEVEDD